MSEHPPETQADIDARREARRANALGDSGRMGTAGTEPPAAEDQSDDGYDEMTVEDLKDAAKAKGVEVKSDMRKDDIIAALRASP